MDLASVQKAVRQNPQGVLIRRIDGTKHRVPHRGYVTFGPPPEERAPRSRHATSRLVWDGTGPALVNAPLVAEITPLMKNGNGHGGKGKKGKPKHG
ncbi:MAG: hypothetical protein JNK58_00260 [Phycisphaerae bacterium]|nr:hypothetical protein [Phycisphaerae bacterium]